MNTITPLFKALLLTVFVGSLSGFTPSRAPGMTINVTTFLDEYTDPGPGTGCSLREAITAANSDATYGGCSAGAGTDTIMLPAGTYTLSRSGTGENGNVTGDLDINSPLTLQGTSMDTTLVDANHIDSAFQIMAGPVNINDLYILNANGSGIYSTSSLILNYVQIRDCGSLSNGGGVSSVLSDPSQSLTVKHSYFRDNGAYQGGAIYTVGRLIIEDSVFYRNHALAEFMSGGGLYSARPEVSIIRTRFDENTGFDAGGNIYLDYSSYDEGSVTIEDSIITYGRIDSIMGIGGGNIATGPEFSDSDLTIRRSEISNGDTNHRNGGGILYTNNLTLENVTISGNYAEDGNGIYNGSQLANISDFTNVTLTDELYLSWFTTINIHNSILTGGCVIPPGHEIVSGYNIESGTSCGFDATGDQQNTNPLIGPLSYLYGFNRLHPLLVGSPAIDKGDPASCPTTDQRGFYRPVDGDAVPGARCDIGAYEYGYSQYYVPLIFRP
jgi:CSLREA domain-containing protein